MQQQQLQESQRRYSPARMPSHGASFTRHLVHLFFFTFLAASSLLVTTSALAVTDAYGFPLLWVVPPVNTSNPYASPAVEPSRNFSYSPAAFGASIASTTSVFGVLGLQATLVTPQSGNENGCARFQAPADFIPPAPTNMSAQGYYADRIVLVQRDSACDDQARALAAQEAGAALVLLVGCPSLLPGGPTGSGALSGHCGWTPLNSTNASVEARVNIPVLLISASDAAGLQAALSSASSAGSGAATVFLPGSGAIFEADWNVLRDLAASMTVSSAPDPLGSSTRPFADLLATTESTYTIPSTTPDGAPTVYTLTQANTNYGLDPCFSRVRGVWCIGGRVVLVHLNGVGVAPVPTVANPRTTNTLPSSLVQLTALTALSLGSNMLQGSLPSGLLNAMESLVYLDLSHQGLTGGVTVATDKDGVVVPSRLQYVNLEDNALLFASSPSSSSSSSSLSLLLGALSSNLKSLNLVSTHFTGPLPSGELGLSTQLEVLQLDRNPLLTGALDEALFARTRQLRVVTADFCGLSGTLPASIGGLVHLTTLSLAHNNFTGPIPDDWFPSGSIVAAASVQRMSTSLETFSFASNALSGALPSGIGAWTSLQTMRLSGNQFSGGLPDEIGSLTQLTHLHLDRNGFTSWGDTPSAWNQLTRLEELWANDNQLTGRVFDLTTATNATGAASSSSSVSLGINPKKYWPNLRVLRLSRNGLFGPIPAVSGLQYLTELTADSNAFSSFATSSSSSSSDLAAAAAGWFDNLPSLVTLSFSDNQLDFPSSSSAASSSSSSSSFPQFLGCTSLESIDFSRNLISTSGIPSAWSLPRLATLRLSHNAMAGSGNLARLAQQCPSLQEVDLSHNQLVLPDGMGDVGAYLNQLPTTIRRVGLSYNRLAGPLTQFGTSGGASGDSSSDSLATQADDDVSASALYANLTQLVLDHNGITLVAPELLSDPSLLPRLTHVDLSCNQIESDQVLGSAPPVASLVTIRLEGNPKLVYSSSSSSSLPSWLAPSSTYTKSTLDQSYSCPTLTGSALARPTLLSVTVDPEFFRYQLCVCDRGTYGAPPACEGVPSWVDYTASPSSSLALSSSTGAPTAAADADGAFFVSSLTDGSFGSARMTPGMDITWVLGAPPALVNASAATTTGGNGTTPTQTTRPVRAVYIDLSIDVGEFNQIHDALLVYAGGDADGDGAARESPWYEFYGATFQQQQGGSSSSSSSRTNSSALLAPSAATTSFFTQRLTIPSSRATLHFRTRSASGTHFTANWSIGYECPTGWRLVEERFLVGAEWTTSAQDGTSSGSSGSTSEGVCLPLYQPSSTIQYSIYATSGFLIAVHLVTILLFLLNRHQRMVKASSLSLCLLMLLWNTILSGSATFFALSPNPYDERASSAASFLRASDWLCQTRPWPVALGLTGVMSALLVRALTLKRIGVSSHHAKLVGGAAGGSGSGSGSGAGAGGWWTPLKMFGGAMALMSAQIILLVVYTTLPLSSLELVATTGDAAPDRRYIFQCSSYHGAFDSGSHSGDMTSRSNAIWLLAEFVLLSIFVCASLWVGCARGRTRFASASADESPRAFQAHKNLAAPSPSASASPFASTSTFHQRDSRSTSHALILLSLLLSVTIGLDFLFDSSQLQQPQHLPDALMALRGFAILLASGAVWCFVFLPKLYLLACGRGNMLHRPTVTLPLTKLQVNDSQPVLPDDGIGSSPCSPSGSPFGGGGGSGGSGSGRVKTLLSSPTSKRTLAIEYESSVSRSGRRSLSHSFLGSPSRFAPAAAAVGHADASAQIIPSRPTVAAAASSPPSARSATQRRMIKLVGSGAPSARPRSEDAHAHSEDEEAKIDDVDDGDEVVLTRRREQFDEAPPTGDISPGQFAAWKRQYDREAKQHYSAEFVRISTAYAIALSAQPSAVLHSRLTRSRLALALFDSWLGDILDAVKSDGEGGELKKLFANLRPDRELLVPLAQEELDQLDDDGEQHRNDVRGMKVRHFVSKLPLPSGSSGLKARGAPPSSPIASIPVSSAVTPSSIQPGGHRSLSSTPSLSLTPGAGPMSLAAASSFPMGGAGGSPAGLASTSLSSSSPGAPVVSAKRRGEPTPPQTPEEEKQQRKRFLTKSTVFSAVRRKAGLDVDVDEMKEADGGSSGDPAPPRRVAKKNLHQRNLSATPSGSAALSTSSSIPLPAAPVRVGMFAKWFTAAPSSSTGGRIPSAGPSSPPRSQAPALTELAATGSPSKGQHRRRKTLEEKDFLSGRGEKSVFLKTAAAAVDPSAMEDGGSGDEAESAVEVDVARPPKDAVARSKSSPMTASAFIRGMRMSQNPIYQADDGHQRLRLPQQLTQREAEARDGSLARMARLKVRLAMAGESASPVSSASSIPAASPPLDSAALVVVDEQDRIASDQLVVGVANDNDSSVVDDARRRTAPSISVVLEAVETANAASVAFAGAATKALTPTAKHEEDDGASADAPTTVEPTTTPVVALPVAPAIPPYPLAQFTYGMDGGAGDPHSDERSLLTRSDTRTTTTTEDSVEMPSHHYQHHYRPDDSGGTTSTDSSSLESSRYSSLDRSSADRVVDVDEPLHFKFIVDEEEAAPATARMAAPAAQQKEAPLIDGRMSLGGMTSEPARTAAPAAASSMAAPFLSLAIVPTTHREVAPLTVSPATPTILYGAFTPVPPAAPAPPAAALPAVSLAHTRVQLHRHRGSLSKAPAISSAWFQPSSASASGVQSTALLPAKEPAVAARMHVQAPVEALVWSQEKMAASHFTTT